ncbi:SsgA family sporulation/cell division regulator [Streptomyces sp. NPDC005498]|uniref:SsgA family sporulation/cell division regulator n=1 Tax=Streptomyces sp. NPDC005498 TaxID=3364717 RepID=UPI0036D03923
MDQRRERAAERADQHGPTTSPTAGRIRHAVRVWLAPAGTLRVPIRAHFEYDRRDPCAVRMSFPIPHLREADWIFARDLLADGLYFPAGAGDIHIAPKTSLTERSLRITLKPPTGTALIEVSRGEVRTFLRATEKLVPRGEENIDIDVFLKECIQDA